MRYQQPLRTILLTTRHLWDRLETRESVRANFTKVVNCRTPALGAEVYASATEQKLVYHTCKSKSCASCGHRATELWQRQQLASLPDVPYASVCFSMPDVLWPIFQDNRHLLRDLPAVGAAVIQQWMKTKYHVRPLVMVVPHTFGRHLNFNAHLHILVSAGGLNESLGQWSAPLRLHGKALMHMWRYAVITYLREALHRNVLASKLDPSILQGVLKAQYERWWSIHIDHFKSTGQFLRYAARYVRRPPIAEHRFTQITDKEVHFWTKDLKLKSRVTTKYRIEEFVSVLSKHVPDRYRHAIRYFGLLAPRSKGTTYAAVFFMLGQQQRAIPRRLSWANSLRQHFGIDPLRDSRGDSLYWVARLSPVAG